jgi:branched-chain amino acid transport system substrate-binding protein
VKAFVPVVAISSDRALTTTNIPWVFRLPDRASLEQALEYLSAAITQAGPNRGKIRELLSSGTTFVGISFESTGEPRKPAMASSR